MFWTKEEKKFFNSEHISNKVGDWKRNFKSRLTLRLLRLLLDSCKESLRKHEFERDRRSELTLH